MRTVYEREIANATEINRTLVQGTARLCSPLFGRVCKLIWPHKTAENLGLAIGCSTRAAAYEISGEREPSAKALAFIFNELVKRE